MDSYLIRIYRRSKDDPEGVVGIVEEIKTGLNHAFQGMSNLCNILSLEKFPEKDKGSSLPLTLDKKLKDRMQPLNEKNSQKEP